MKISNKFSNMVEFGKLPFGNVFKHISSYCMKVEYNNEANMVYLSDGSLGWLSDSEQVEVVHCELVVEN